MTNFEYIPIPCRGGCRLVWFRPRLLFRVFVFKPYLREKSQIFRIWLLFIQNELHSVFGRDDLCSSEVFLNKKNQKDKKIKSISKWCIQKCKLHTETRTWSHETNRITNQTKKTVKTMTMKLEIGGQNGTSDGC